MKALLRKNIPRELRRLNQWVLWRNETVDGRLTKIPYQVSGKRAKPNDRRTWSPFVDVIRFDRGEFDGIGFVF
ncbi:MAG: hypothetical protein KDB27_21575, partial [Planctomycetales bacterium]|nr:hypothetical protein [Planctomycetales bacterium]